MWGKWLICKFIKDGNVLHFLGAVVVASEIDITSIYLYRVLSYWFMFIRSEKLDSTTLYMATNYNLHTADLAHTRCSACILLSVGLIATERERSSSAPFSSVGWLSSLATLQVHWRDKCISGNYVNELEGNIYITFMKKAQKDKNLGRWRW